ncbi:MAG TPA: hypothetical protein VFH39_00655 [Candidatus Saccharimonadales bacterium]|nr:hypothetical protein [Candidatus Saccharimonadales bacterium]
MAIALPNSELAGDDRRRRGGDEFWQLVGDLRLSGLGDRVLDAYKREQERRLGAAQYAGQLFSVDARADNGDLTARHTVAGPENFLG